MPSNRKQSHHLGGAARRRIMMHVAKMGLVPYLFLLVWILFIGQAKTERRRRISFFKAEVNQTVQFRKPIEVESEIDSKHLFAITDMRCLVVSIVHVIAQYECRATHGVHYRSLSEMLHREMLQNRLIEPLTTSDFGKDVVLSHSVHHHA